jgi:mono/diheme cytochrome c family protein
VKISGKVVPKYQISGLLAGAIIFIGIQVTATGDQSAPVQRQKTKEIPRPSLNDANVLKRYARGGRLFVQHCARCHGRLAEGAPNWQQPDAEGRYPAPPLNGTAHAWHHPTAALKKVIREGTGKLGGNMPAMGSVVSDRDMDDIILWFQSHWPDELYQAWWEMELKAKAHGAEQGRSHGMTQK